MNKFPLTKFQRRVQLLTWLLAGLTIASTACFWRDLPKVMPIHYDVYGIANDWGGRWTVWILPVLLVICCGIVSLCARLPLRSLNLPFRVNMEREWFVLRAVRDALCVMGFEVALLFAVMQFQMLLAQNLAFWFQWGMAGVIVATLIFGVWRSWKCNQGTL